MTTTPTIFLTGRTNFAGYVIGSPDVIATQDDGFRIEVLSAKEDSGINLVDQYDLVDPSGTMVEKYGSSLTRQTSGYDIQITQQVDGKFDSSFILGYRNDGYGTATYHPEDSYLLINLSDQDAVCNAMFESRALANGGFISLWGQTIDDGDAQRTSVWFREVGADEQPIGDPASVMSDSTENQSAGIMTVLKDGDVVIGWDNAAPGATVAELTIRRYNDQGQPVADSTIIATHDAGAATAVQALSGGGYVVAWNEASTHQSMFQLFAADGTAQGAAVGFAGDFNGQIASVYDGGFVIEATDGGGFLQRYSADGFAIGDHLAASGELATLADGRIALVTLFSGYTIIDPRDYEISGTASDDIIYGRIDGSEISGLEGNDALFGGAAVDILRGGAGDDTLEGGHAGDQLRGSDGNDLLTGDNGNDDLDGGPGNDRLLGGSGNDTLTGGGDADVLNGGGGRDVLTGGDGADMLTGGKGNDVFALERPSESGNGAADRDTITDFSTGHDKIDFHMIDADRTRQGQQSFTFIGTDAFTGAEQVRYVVQGSMTLVQSNTDDDLRADISIALDGKVKLTAADFIFSSGNAPDPLAGHGLVIGESMHGMDPMHHLAIA